MKKLYKKHYTIDPEVAEKIVKEYLDGFSSTVLGKKYNVASKTVTDYIKRTGYKCKPRKKYESLNADEKKQIIDLYTNKNMLMKEIAEKFELSLPTIRKCFDKSENFTVLANKKRILSNNQSKINALYSTYIRSARARALDFNISLENFSDLLFLPCYYCNRIKVNTGRKNKTGADFKYNGLDRVDNNIGYIIDNVVTCCSQCNAMKSSLSKEDFLSLILLIAKQHGDK